MLVRVAFYVDCSLLHGTGHVMRSSVLGIELVSKGHTICFYGTLDKPEWIWRYLDSNKICIHGPYSVKEHGGEPSLVFVDSYSQELFNKISLTHPELPVVTIEDDHTPTLASNLRILQTMDLPERMEELSGNNSRIMYGPEYMLIRKSLRDLNFENPGPAKVINVLVMSGGSNSTGFINIFSQIAAQLIGNYKFHIIGDAPTSLTSAALCLKFYPYGTRPEDIPVSFAVAISLSGVSSIEILSSRIPLIVAAGTRNQFPLFRYLTLNEFAVPLACITEFNMWKFSVTELQAALSEALRRDIKPNPFDYLGAERILRNLEIWLDIEF